MMLHKLAKHLMTLSDKTLNQVIDALPSEEKLKVIEIIKKIENDSRSNN